MVGFLFTNSILCQTSNNTACLPMQHNKPCSACSCRWSTVSWDIKWILQVFLNPAILCSVNNLVLTSRWQKWTDSAFPSSLGLAEKRWLLPHLKGKEVAWLRIYVIISFSSFWAFWLSLMVLCLCNILCFLVSVVSLPHQICSFLFCVQLHVSLLS